MHSERKRSTSRTPGTRRALSSRVSVATARQRPKRRSPLEVLRQAALRWSTLQWALWVYVFATVAVLALLSAMARARAFFPADPLVERSIQAVTPGPLGRVLDGVSWAGFPPQVDMVMGLGVVIVLMLGYRWEAMCLAFAALTGGVSWWGMSLLIGRPRPSPDLVHVERLLSLGGYPSGHVVNLTAFFGSLFVLVWLCMPSTWYRIVMQAVAALLIMCIGVARIYSGEHWPSDVLAGYLQGSIVVAVTLLLYLHHPTTGTRTRPPVGPA